MIRELQFTVSQIIATRERIEGGQQAKDVRRELDISGTTYCVWKSKHGGT